MDRPEMRAELRKLLVTVNEDLEGKVEDLQDDAQLRDTLGLDSLQVTELLFEIEEKFGAKIEDEEAMQLRTFGDVLDLIAAKTSEQG